MRLIAILSWYDEAPSWLAATVASLPKAGVTHLVAVDGAYGLYPSGRAKSGPEQHAAISETAASLGLACTIHTPASVYEENEVEKRNLCFRLAEASAEPNVDWYFVIDADTVVDIVDELPARLAATELDVADFELYTRFDPFTNPDAAVSAHQATWPREHTCRVRSLYRAIPGLCMARAHFRVQTPDGRLLWGNAAAGDALEPVLELAPQQLRCEHRTNLRDLGRKELQKAYYLERDRAGVERGPCQRCRDRRAEITLPTDWEEHEHGLLAGWVEVCSECAPSVRAESAQLVRELGYDPSDLKLGPAVEVRA